MIRISALARLVKQVCVAGSPHLWNGRQFESAVETRKRRGECVVIGYNRKRDARKFPPYFPRQQKRGISYAKGRTL